jgi:hypothetical protein
MVAQNEFQGHSPGFVDAFVVSDHLHPFGYFRGTSRLVSTHSFHLDHTNVTRGKRFQSVVIAESWDLDPVPSGELKDGFPGHSFHEITVKNDIKKIISHWLSVF